VSIQQGVSALLPFDGLVVELVVTEVAGAVWGCSISDDGWVPSSISFLQSDIETNSVKRSAVAADRWNIVITKRQ
jgi:hypothetical protein